MEYAIGHAAAQGRGKTTVRIALRRGSVTAIAYSVSEDASMTGVQQRAVLPGLPSAERPYYCFFLPLVLKGKFAPELLTGILPETNRNRVLVNAGELERNFRKDTLNISDNF